MGREGGVKKPSIITPMEQLKSSVGDGHFLLVTLVMRASKRGDLGDPQLRRSLKSILKLKRYVKRKDACGVFTDRKAVGNLIPGYLLISNCEVIGLK